jgi:hypothetical protein
MTNGTEQERDHDMHEPYDSRVWADHGHEVSAAMHEVFAKIGEAFRTLSDIEFSAPWVKPSSRGC